MEKIINCIVCNKKIIVTNGNQARKIFCSKKCSIYYYNRNIKGKQNFCQDCGKQISLAGKRCQACAYKKINYNGSKNPRWKGGTSEGYQIKIYREILKGLGIDLDICQECKNNIKEGLKMQVHHKDGNHQNNSPNNLINLCTKCHSIIHNGKPKVKIICKFCKKEFEVIPCKKNKRTFCSRECSNKYYNEKRIGVNDHIFLRCLHCNKEFSFPPSRLKKGKPKYCSQKCNYEHRKTDRQIMKEWNKKMKIAKNKKR